MELQNVVSEEHLKEENKMANPRYNKQVAQPRTKAMGGGVMRRDMRSGYYPSDMGMEGGAMMKKGGRVKKKKQGYKDRKDESIAMRIKKKRTKKQLKASRDESYGCLLYTSPSPRDGLLSRMPSSA